MSRFQLFDYVKSINNKESHLFDEAPDAVGGFVPYHVLTAFSYFPDTVLFANELNMYPDTKKLMQYDYLYYTISPRKRFSKWHKQEKTELLENIKKCYKVNVTKAKEIRKLLTDEQKTYIENMYSQKR